MSTKLNIPLSSPNLVARPRLLRRLDEGLQPGCLLTLVCAPAGYGKTTLVSEWVRHTVSASAEDSLRFAWLTLDASDDDLARFLEYLVAALHPLYPGVGKGMLAGLQAPRPSPPPSLATLLINDLADIPGRLVVVLDDYHTVSSPAIHDWLTFLLDHPPPHLHWVVLSRADPPLPVARLRARGQLTELRLADLRFTAEEAALYLNEAMKLGLAEELADALNRRTEGWISGLQLASLSLRQMKDRRAFVASFSGGYEHVADYLTDEVLSAQPPAMRSFLLDTSILERLSGPLCAAVTGRADAGEMLQALHDANLFLVPLDAEGDWYRYHGLFADLLRKRLQQARPAALAELHGRACAWYRQNGWLQEAVEHALAAGDPDHAAATMEQASEPALKRGEAATVRRWLEALPDAAKDQHPILWLFQALAGILGGQSSPTLRDRVEQMAAAGGFPDRQGELATVLALWAVLGGKGAEAVRLAEQAWRHLPADPSFFRSMAADTRGMAYMMSGDTSSAAGAFQDALETAAQGGYVIMELMALSNLAGLRFLLGQLRASAAAYHHVLALAEERLGKGSPVIGKALLGLGELAREWNDLDAALGYYERAVALYGRNPDVGAAMAHASIAWIQAVRGQWEASSAATQRARDLARASTSTRLDDRLVESIEARLWILQGELERAADWARRSGLLDRPFAEVVARAGPAAAAGELVQADYVILAHLFLAQRQFDQALQTLQPLLAVAQQMGYLRRVIGLTGLQALALHGQGKQEEAILLCGQALALAAPEGFRRTFLDEGEPMARLVYLAMERGHSPGFAGELLQAFAAELPAAAPVREAVAQQALIEPLSARELEVLAGIAAGLSNREIGQRLHLTLSTVKWHTANIYGKLGVNSRTQAVSRARALGLPLPD